MCRVEGGLRADLLRVGVLGDKCPKSGWSGVIMACELTCQDHLVATMHFRDIEGERVGSKETRGMF